MKVCDTFPAAADCFADLSSQVYLPDIVGHVPAKIVHAISSFMEFYYLIHCNIITEDYILAIENAVIKFHIEHSVFNEV